jgi:glycosyl hydrolase family 26
MALTRTLPSPLAPRVALCLIILTSAMSALLLVPRGAAAAPVTPAAGAPAPPAADNFATSNSIGSKRTCIYSSSSVSTLEAVGAMLGVDFNCALVYGDSAQTWAQWDDPWFITDPDSDTNWARWVQAAPGRTMILSIPLFPTDLNGTSWLGKGASGAFRTYAKTLAKNLVSAGLGSSVIRLAWEANGDWYPDSVGNTPAKDASWVRFWRATAKAMMSVTGAEFSFDWCVNAAYRNIPLANYYPGDDVVDEIGIDLYDGGLPSTVSDRWSALSAEPGSLATVLAFAQAHGKPISIPEWGVGPSAIMEGGGDDPGYVNGIASTVAGDNVAYQSYFFAESWAQGLASYPNSLSAYQHAFGTETPSGTPSSALASLPTPLPLL